jgi:hypothetical protein
MADKFLQGKIDDILSGQGKGQQRLESFLSGEADAAPPRPLFSAFVDEHVARASDLAERFINITNAEGLNAAVEAIERALHEEPVAGLVQYAIKLFMTHSPEARANLKLKPLEIRQPNLVVPSESLNEEREELADELGEQNEEAGAPTLASDDAEATSAKAARSERLLNFWREDPLINEHHEHWHLVYPMRPVPFPSGAKPAGGYNLGDRHGELFAYMHEQMLARYDAERLALRMKKVVPFDKYPLTGGKFSAPIAEGYDPGNLRLWDGEQWYQFRARPNGAEISDLTLDETPTGGPNWATRPGAKISGQVDFGNALFSACDNGNYQLLSSAQPVTIDNLGDTVEANVESVDYYGNPDVQNWTHYGNFHNDGHIHFMIYDNIVPYGVMGTTATAIRDPIFFRWHKLIDDIYDNHRKTLAPHDFSDAPAVKIRKSDGQPADKQAASIDIILSLESGLPASIAGHKFGSTAYNNLAAAAFGYSDNTGANNWDKDFTKGSVKLSSGETITTTDELTTEMLTRKLNVIDQSGNPETQEIGYLSHEDFYYFIRVQNNLSEPQTVVARIFLAPEDEIDDRRTWIELDRFSYGLKPQERAVLFRPSDQSSVVRKPALKPDDLTADDGASPAREAQPWCDCGWSYTALLPRGTKKGMRFRLLVMLSNGSDLIMPDHPECCTAISYCGLQDLKYPDKAPMGFPFDRDFRDSLTETVNKYDNWAWRTVNIRCKNL